MNQTELFYYEVALVSKNTSSFTYSHREKITNYNRVLVDVKNREIMGYIIKKVKKPDFTCKAILLIYNDHIPKNYFDIAHFITKYYVCKIGEALSLFYPFTLEKKESKDINLVCDIELSSKQEEAYMFLKNKKVSLLFGDTGSGKTEIYIKLITDVINSGNSAIMLMPEISLTPQISKRLKKYFGETLAIWHSKIPRRKKDEILADINNKKIKVVAGTRSSLFLPLSNLSLIIVDEEHDFSYKSSQKPRINAKDLAIYLSSSLGVSTVLGSATPSLSSYKKLDKFRLTGGYFESQKRFYFDNTIYGLSMLALQKIEEKLSKNEQIIIFLPTRANFKYLVCDECGETHKCPYCDVGMSLHSHIRILKCHYCNYSAKIEERCTLCNKGRLINKRIGTSEVCDILREQFSGARISKFDRDEITTTNKLKTTLKDFNDKKIDILVGTQMLSKGHDYHNVSLAIVLDIDYILNSANFRAREEALSLLIQISGRSGRKKDGEVVVQTLNRDFFTNYIDDYELFIKDELKMRDPLYPPYKKFANIMFADKKADVAEANMQKCIQKMDCIKDVEIVGYGESAISKIASRYRFHILTRSDSSNSLLKVMHFIDDKESMIDIDPTSIF
jgi:primosomal protein N' (replication factor Y)